MELLLSSLSQAAPSDTFSSHPRWMREVLLRYPALCVFISVGNASSVLPESGKVSDQIIQVSILDRKVTWNSCSRGSERREAVVFFCLWCYSQSSLHVILRQKSHNVLTVHLPTLLMLQQSGFSARSWSQSVFINEPVSWTYAISKVSLYCCHLLFPNSRRTHMGLSRDRHDTRQNPVLLRTFRPLTTTSLQCKGVQFWPI